MTALIQSIAMRLQASSAKDELDRYLKSKPKREPLVKKLQWFRYTGPMVRWGPPKNGSPQTFFINKQMLMGVKPQGNNALVLVPTIDQSNIIPMDLARKLAKHVKPVQVGSDASEGKKASGIKLPSGNQATPQFLDGLFKWFYGDPVKDKAFYREVEQWPSQKIKCYRVMLVHDPKVGQKAKLGPFSIYSGSSSPNGAANGWYNWAETNNTLKRIPKGAVPVLVEFPAGEVKATTAQLKPLVNAASNGRHPVTDTLLLFKEIWLAGGQVGKIVKILDLKKLDKLYGW